MTSSYFDERNRRVEELRRAKDAAWEAFLERRRAVVLHDPEYLRVQAVADQFDVEDESAEARAAWDAVDEMGEKLSRRDGELVRLDKAQRAAERAYDRACDEDEDEDDDDA